MAPLWVTLLVVLLGVCVLMALLLAITGGVSQKKHNVLLVIDMQKDYDIASNLLMYGRVRSPYCSNISSIVPAVNRVWRSKQWDRVVFTKDWLVPEELRPGYPFCIKNTSGAEQLDGLWTRDDDIIFTKNKDDAFNTVMTPSRGFGLRNEGVALGAASNELVDVLGRLGFSPADTVLTLVGQLTNRCILKSSVHARSLGFDVEVIEAASFASDSATSLSWSVPAPSTLVIGDRRWMRSIYTSEVGPGRAEAWDYMRRAGVHVVPRGSQFAGSGLPAAGVLNSSQELLIEVGAGNFERVRLLLEMEGADVEVRQEEYNGGVLRDVTPLIIAAAEGHVLIAEYLVVMALAQIDAKSLRGYSPLQEAVWYNHTDIVRFLVDRGADVESRCNDGSTALLSASHQGNLAMVRYLVETGAADPEARTHDGFTPLLYAAWQDKLEIVRYLVETVGVNAAARTEQGLCMKQFALRGGSPELQRYTEEHFPSMWTRLETVCSRWESWAVFGVGLLTALLAGCVWSKWFQMTDVEWQREAKRFTRAETGADMEDAALMPNVDGYSHLPPASGVHRERRHPSAGACLVAAHHYTKNWKTLLLKFYRGLEIVATIVYPFSLCMYLVWPWMWVPVILISYMLPASFAFGAWAVLRDPVLLATTSGSVRWHRLVVIARTVALFPLAMTMCQGGAQPARWLSPDKVWCNGNFANSKARWFIDPDWDVWENRTQTVAFFELDEGFLFEYIFRRGVFWLTALWVIAALISVYFMESDKKSRRRRVKKVQELALWIDNEGIDKLGCCCIPRTRLQCGKVLGCRAEVAIVTVDFMWFDLSSTVFFLLSGEFMFAYCLFITVMTTLAIQIGDLKAGYSPCAVVWGIENEIQESIERGVHTSKLMRLIQREKSHEGPVCLAITAYGLPFVARNYLTFFNGILSISVSIYGVATYIFEKIDLLADCGVEEVEDSSEDEAMELAEDQALTSNELSGSADED